MAREARALAERAHSRLQSFATDAVKRSAAWQALLVAYLHAGQAANSLLPEYEGVGGTALDLRSARSALDDASHANLDPGCFIPAPAAT